MGLGDTPTENDKPLQDKIISTMKSEEDISVSIIQRKFKVGYFLATRVFNILCKNGIIESYENPIRFNTYRIKP